MKNLEFELQDFFNRFKRTVSEEGFDDFPYMFCDVVSRRLTQEFGFALVMGKYLGRFSASYLKKAREYYYLQNNNLQVPHHFCYDRKTGLYIDLTSSQFTPENPDVLLIESSSPRIVKNYDIRTVYSSHLVLNGDAGIWISVLRLS